MKELIDFIKEYRVLDVDEAFWMFLILLFFTGNILSAFIFLFIKPNLEKE